LDGKDHGSVDEPDLTYQAALDQIREGVVQDRNVPRALAKLRSFHENLLHEAALSSEGLVGYFITAIFVLEILPYFLPDWNLNGIAGAAMTAFLGLVGAWGIFQVYRAWEILIGVPRVPRPRWVDSLDNTDHCVERFLAALEEYRRKNRVVLEYDHHGFTDRARSAMKRVGAAFMAFVIISAFGALGREVYYATQRVSLNATVPPSEITPSPEPVVTPPPDPPAPDPSPTTTPLGTELPQPHEQAPVWLSTQVIDQAFRALFLIAMFILGGFFLYASFYRTARRSKISRVAGATVGAGLLTLSLAISFNLIQIKGFEFTAIRLGGGGEAPTVNLDKLISITTQPVVQVGGEAAQAARFEHIVTVGPFDSGVDKLLQGLPEDVCRRIKRCVADSRHCFFFAVGGSDQRPLSPKSKSAYETNTGLSLARANWVKNEILALLTPEIVSPTNIVALSTGCRVRGIDIAADKLSEDRNVEVYALWLEPPTTSGPSAAPQPNRNAMADLPGNGGALRPGSNRPVEGAPDE
jgi:hypothetical protein